MLFFVYLQKQTILNTEYMNNTTSKIAGHIVDIENERVYTGTVSVADGRITLQEQPSLPLSSDAPYILPGFVDSHIHIESTLLLPENFARLAVRQGTVAAVCDPHEIANVLGIAGIDYMIESGRKTHFHFYNAAPSCVPSTCFETAGAAIGPEEIESLMQRDDIFGLAEMMNAFGAVNGDPEVLAKIAAAQRHGKPIDGHAPGFRGEDARKYVALGVSTDHECTSLAEAEERIILGMKILIREGSAACDFEELSPLLAKYGDMLMFCTDDKYADELMQGHINTLVQRAVAKGYPLWNVLRAACVTPVKHYRLRHGILRDGDPADFILVDNLSDFNIMQTWLDGVKVYDRNEHTPDSVCRTTGCETPQVLPNQFKAQPLEVSALRIAIPAGTERIKVIAATEGSLITRCMTAAPRVVDGNMVSNPDEDVLKLVVLNRYAAAPPAIAFIHGFQLQRGAIASTIAHDCHNIIALGCSDEEIVRAVNHLISTQGGIAACDGQQIWDLTLPVAGLMSPLSGEDAGRKHIELKAKVREMGCPFAAPYMTLAFMALPVIPELKLTDKGLFDGTRFEFTSILA